MKILCMPGGLCNSKTMEAQIGPIMDHFSEADNVSFRVVGGINHVYPPAEFAGFFGPPPNFTFVDSDAETFIHRAWGFAKTGNIEESVKIGRQARSNTFDIMQNSINYLMDIIDQDEEIEGILGYSESAWVGASIVVEEQYRQRQSGRIPRVKFGVFIGGFPPTERESGEVVMASKVGQIIDIPTIHVIGAADPFVDGGRGLYDVCNPDKAEIFGHQGGHGIPRDLRTLYELAEVIREVITGIESA